MPEKTRIFKVILITAAIFLGLTAVAFGAYYVYEHREEIPFIRDFFDSEEKLRDDSDDSAQSWDISIDDGNVVKTYQSGGMTVLVDKNDYENIEYFMDVSVSPDKNHMCFLAQTIVPIWLYYAEADGSNVTEVDIAQECHWSNDSSMISYINHTTDVSQHDVYVYFLETDSSTNFTEDLSTDSIMRIYQDPEWSDDDTTITSPFHSYDDNNDWQQTDGFSIITIATGDVRDVASNVDTSNWLEFEQEETGISLMYPPDWSVSETCEYDPDEYCIVISNDDYEWTLGLDPFVTGGGFGFLFDSVAQPSTTIYTALSIDGYSPYLVTNYYDGATLSAEMGNPSIPAEGELWGWSVVFTDPDNYSTLGFGPGEMYDDIDNNRWSITYKKILVYPNEGMMDFSDVPLKGDADLYAAILIMNAISESVQVP